ncbi:MFS domain-containing protein [Aphelenchoides besseyi]|nr:MFS domain-containing protein [Aphelenchoides besseyi]
MKPRTLIHAPPNLRTFNAIGEVDDLQSCVFVVEMTEPLVDKPNPAEKEPIKSIEDASPYEPVVEPKTLKKLDDFIVLGRYTLLICILGEFLILNQLGNMFYMMYSGAEPKLVSCGQNVFNTTLNQKARCQLYEAMNNGTQKCTPVLEPQFQSVNYDWGYFCSKNKLVKQSVSVQMIGVIIGAVIFGQFSDACGRKPALLTALAGCITCMVASSFTNDLLTFTIARFLVNVFNGGCIAVQLVFSVENLPKRDRFWITNIITWSPNIMVYALIAYLTGDWRTLTRVSAVLTFVAVIVLLFCCESPRYLIQRREIDKARAAIKRIWKIDGRQLDEGELDDMLQRELDAATKLQQKKKRYTYLHLLYTSELTRYTIAIGFSLLATSLVTYSLLFNMEKLSGSIYTNSLIMGGFRYTLNLITAISDIKFKWLGRKLVHALAEGAIILALLFFIVVYLLGKNEELRFFCSLAVLTVLANTTLLFSTNGVLSSELFPTGIRNLSFSFGQVMSRIGTVLAPQIFFLSDFWNPLPYFVLIGFAAVDFVIFHFNTEETKGKEMRANMPSKNESWWPRKHKPTAGQDEPIELLPTQDMEGNPVKLAT